MMKNSTSRIWITMMTIVLLLTSIPNTAMGYPIKLAQEERYLSGIMASNQSYFHIPSYWNVESTTISLDYTATQLTRENESSVTLYVNGTPFHSFRPIIEGNKKQTLKVTIPTHLLVKGPNLLTIEGSIRTIEDRLVCSEDEWRDNWFHVYQSTVVDVNYSLRPHDGTIKDFSERFVGMDTMNSSNNVIVVPQNSEHAELEAATHVISGYSKADVFKDHPLLLQPYTSGTLPNKPYVVIVSLRKDLPPVIENQLSKQDWSKTAVIQVVNNGAGQVLVVTSDDPTLLVKAGRLLANSEMVKQLDSGLKIVNESTDVNTRDVAIHRTMKLTETGDKLVGPYHQEHRYFITLPANRAIADASMISLDFRYAKNLDFDRSLVTILVDDKPIGSKRLNEDLADNDSLTLPIPKNINIAGNFSITVAFDLELKSNYCIRNESQMPWAFVTTDSLLKLNTKDNTDLLFDNYPYPFLRDGNFNHVAVVLPKERDGAIYESVSNVFSLLGQYAEGNKGEIHFYNDDESSDQWSDKNIIAIGGYTNNSLIRGNNDKLYFRYDPNGHGFLSNEKMSIESRYGTRIGALQLMESPYHSGRALLAITGSKSEYSLLASKLISGEKNRWKVWGDAVVADKDGNVSAFRFKQQAEAEPEGIFDNVIARPDLLGFLVAAVLVLLLVLLSLLLMIRKYRNKRGGNNES
ncbi:cellulose biosynthesis cyclic di-GMP-binding regulatory protein BcsB [Paenibacillus sp. GSMTC-2017]|uniref:cellulose biosynthesis cyclic di-GMP-binding regulatory protein BcsB n=1 Tax=Paenibacillus sp. GSMTC-2017 TaxID=2794350 RepID=UPI0018D6C5B2|nr:cellulose biosynthesis cyclic di-GMP-binding regulatory protein BcsB [Paenibacillus sp. GSMTC-2017]MBH5317528.1 cellulose biosynthesis cyclic di-GMP-binding regulatory protein BcsB [Paenibacillus sp. GSMTC-2017]